MAFITLRKKKIPIIKAKLSKKKIMVKGKGKSKIVNSRI